MVDISVIIPVYNLEKYISECLDSLLNQTFKDFEIICVNDGSKDSSLAILEEYAKADARIKVMSQDNGGAGSARNSGLKLAKGKYIQFLDGDDYFEFNMLEVLYNLAERYNADIAVCSSKKVDDNGNITERKNPNSPLNLYKIILNKPFSYKDFPDDIFSLTGTAPWNKLYRRELIQNQGLFFPNYVGPDDLCFVHKAIVCAERIVAIDDELINYRYNRPGSVQTYRANHTLDIIKAFLDIKDFLISQNKYNLLKNAYNKALLFSLRWEISLCNDEQYASFLKQLKGAFPTTWREYLPALKRDHITLDYLYEFIGDKKVYLWGASNFLKNLLENEHIKNQNILGIIDKNEASWGKTFGNYKIYSPNILNVEPANILMTIYNNHESAYDAIKEEVCNKYPQIELLDNIFVAFYYAMFIPNDTKQKLLHMAPEKTISEYLQKRKNIDYVCIDLYPENFKYAPNCLKMDVLDLKFADNTFDFIISNHVVEHIDNEAKFFSEIKRVLKPNGKAIISAPYNTFMEVTFEDHSIITEEARLKAYGQADRVRMYGKDIYNRFRQYGKITIINRNAFPSLIADQMCLGLETKFQDAVVIFEKDS